jgi:ABC-2 type transport system ATP-binding protein
MTTAEKVIEVRDLAKSYGAIRALAGVTFAVRRGEVLGFLGPNGAGKTTTMKILTCFIAPTEGRAAVAGFDIFAHPLEVRRVIGYLPENAPLYSDMRVAEYLDFVGEIRGLGKAARRGAADRVIEQCGLGEVVHQEIRTLSKGYRQRAGLAQAMIHDPAILILDEPTSGLDPNQIAEIRNLIKRIGRERTVILSTHNLAEVQMTADRVVIIHQGRLVADGSIGDLERQRGGAIYDVVVAAPAGGKGSVEDALRAIDGVGQVAAEEAPGDGELRIAVRGSGDKDVRAEIFRAAVANGWTLLGLGRKHVDLESIFKGLTTADGPAGGGGAKKEVAR